MLFDTTKCVESKRISKKSILDRLSEYDIFKRYIGPIKIGKVYNSPLREDKSPSFAIFVSNRDKALLYRDMATGDTGDVFKFVKQLFGFNSYYDVYQKIYDDMSLFIDGVELTYKTRLEVRNTQISIKRMEFTEKDLEFWSNFGIKFETLKKYNVSPISTYYVNNIPKGIYSELEPMYAYKVFNKFKIYRPLSSKINKWRGNLSSTDIQGYEQLSEKGDLLIITKSLKDVMCLRELGYEAIAPASESTMIPEIVVNKIKSRFKNIIMLYDRDSAGLKFTRKTIKKYGFKFMFINKKYKTKDISDFVKLYGLAKAMPLMKEMIEKS